MSDSVVTYVVPMYDAETYLAETLRSIEQQTDPRWTAVLVDDGSNDGSAGIGAEFVRRHPGTQMLRQSNAGVSAARNRGADAARTFYLTFLDADDVLDPEHLASLIAAAGDRAAVYGNARYIDGDGQRQHPGVLERWTVSRTSDGETLPASHLWNAPCIMTPGQMLVQADVHRAIGGFEPHLRAGEDWDYQARLAESGTVAYVDRVVLSYRRHDRNTSAVHAARTRMSAQAVRLRAVDRVPSPRARRQVLRAHRRFFASMASVRARKGEWRLAGPSLVMLLAYSGPLSRVNRTLLRRRLPALREGDRLSTSPDPPSDLR